MDIASGSTAIGSILVVVVLVHYTMTSDAFGRRFMVPNGGECVGEFDSIRLDLTMANSTTWNSTIRSKQVSTGNLVRIRRCDPNKFQLET